MDSLLTRMLETLRSIPVPICGGIAGSAIGLLADPHARDSTQYTYTNLWGIAGSAIGLFADTHASDSTQYTVAT